MARVTAQLPPLAPAALPLFGTRAGPAAEPYCPLVLLAEDTGSEPGPHVAVAADLSEDG